MSDGDKCGSFHVFYILLLKCFRIQFIFLQILKAFENLVLALYEKYRSSLHGTNQGNSGDWGFWINGNLVHFLISQHVAFPCNFCFSFPT